MRLNITQKGALFMSLNGFSRSLFTFFLASVLGLAVLPAYSSSNCKGLDEAVCKQSTACNWISGYTTKSGNTVSAYCRSAGSKAKQGMKQEKDSQLDSNDRANTSAKTDMRILEERNG
jgi:hypothetical protein